MSNRSPNDRRRKRHRQFNRSVSGYEEVKPQIYAAWTRMNLTANKKHLTYLVAETRCSVYNALLDTIQSQLEEDSIELYEVFMNLVESPPLNAICESGAFSPSPVFRCILEITELMIQRFPNYTGSKNVLKKLIEMTENKGLLIVEPVNLMLKTMTPEDALLRIETLNHVRNSRVLEKTVEFDSDMYTTLVAEDPDKQYQLARNIVDQASLLGKVPTDEVINDYYNFSMTNVLHPTTLTQRVWWNSCILNWVFFFNAKNEESGTDEGLITENIRKTVSELLLSHGTGKQSLDLVLKNTSENCERLLYAADAVECSRWMSSYAWKEMGKVLDEIDDAIDWTDRWKMWSNGLYNLEVVPKCPDPGFKVALTLLQKMSVQHEHLIEKFQRLVTR